MISRVFAALAALTALGIALVYVAAWVPVYPFSLLEHFRVQYVAAGALAAIAAALAGVRRFADLAAIATLLHALPVTADLHRAPATGPVDGARVRALILNVHTESRAFDRVRQLIADERPDLIALVEVDERWLTALAPALAAYPGRIEQPRPDNFGIALYARGSVTGAIEALGSELPTIVARVVLDGASLDVIATHPLPPISAAAHDQLHRQLGRVAARARAARAPVLVVGDFNATPWSAGFADLLAHGQLCDTRAGFGIQASFPAPSLVLRIPIDHALASCTIGIRDRKIAADVGSDHLPVVVDLTVPRAALSN